MSQSGGCEDRDAAIRQRADAEVTARSCTKTSWASFMSLSIRLVAQELNETKRPFALIDPILVVENADRFAGQPLPWVSS
ncbi:MAG: hypothetical protein ACRDLB_07195 [Actinomycetota bacterium]